MLNIIICGAPGCGKGTQSDLIVSKYKLKHLSTGDLLRKEIQDKTEIGKEAETYISQGQLVPDEMIIKIISKCIDNISGKYNGVILDGFPRTVAQAEALESFLISRNKTSDLLIDLVVEKDELVARLLKRGETSGRSDDNLETIQKRLEVYHEKTAPVNNYYKQSNKYTRIDGMGSIDDIFSRIVNIIEPIIESKNINIKS